MQLYIDYMHNCISFQMKPVDHVHGEGREDENDPLCDLAFHAVCMDARFVTVIVSHIERKALHTCDDLGSESIIQRHC